MVRGLPSQLFNYSLQAVEPCDSRRDLLSLPVKQQPFLAGFFYSETHWILKVIDQLVIEPPI